MHRPLGYLVLVIVAVHVRFVSDTFHQGLPMWGLYLLVAGVGLMLGWSKWRAWSGK